MTNEMLSAIISGASGILGAFVGGWMTLHATNKQIKEQKELLRKEEEEKTDLAIKIVVQYLWHEIDLNCYQLNDNTLTFKKKLESNKISQYAYKHWAIKLTEFNNVKYELLKYKTPIVKDVLDIYNKFIILTKYQDLKELTQEEFNNVRNLFDLHEKIENYIYRRA